MKTSELTGVALDWAVAKCEGFTAEYEADIGDFWIERTNHKYTRLAPFGYLKDAMHFSTDWAQAGPIIEREKIKVAPNLNGTWLGQIRHEKDHPRVAQKVLAGWTNQHGPTPLIAAMRCFVASKLGDDIEVPPELK